jgi:hypothetical protein
MIYAGVDPGSTGAIGLIDSNGAFVAVHDWPGDEHALVRLLQDELDILGVPTLALVEEQQAMGQGFAAAMLKLGRNHGIWLGVLAALRCPVAQIKPAVWKKGLLPPKAGKDVSLAVARRMWPTAPLNLKKHDGRADALLLAHVARTKYGRIA